MKPNTNISQALELFKKTLGDDHLYVGFCLSNIGSLFQDKGEIQRAKSFYLMALEIYSQNISPDHPRHLKLLSKLNAIPDHIEPLPLEDLGL